METKAMKLRFYTIEKKSNYWGRQYRFRSLYNSVVGAWTSFDHAKKDGESHKELILRLT